MRDLRGVGGVWTAGILPFRADGRIDGDAFQSFLAWNCGHEGVNAIVVNAHASEYASARDEEYETVIGLARAVAQDAGVAVVSGVSAEDGAKAARWAERAAEAGADAILLFPPEGFGLGGPLRPRMYVDYVGEALGSGVEQVCYFQRPVSRAGLRPDDLVELCSRFEQIVAIKEGSDDVETYAHNVELIAQLDRPVSILSSNNRALFATLAVGGEGVLTGSASVIPGHFARMIGQLAQDRISAARETHRDVSPLLRALYLDPLIDMHTRMKTALQLMGVIPSDAVRPPLQPVSSTERETLRRALGHARLLP